MSDDTENSSRETSGRKDSTIPLGTETQTGDVSVGNVSGRDSEDTENSSRETSGRRDSTISLGTGTQIGDVSIGNASGRDIIHNHYNNPDPRPLQVLVILVVFVSASLVLVIYRQEIFRLEGEGNNSSVTPPVTVATTTLELTQTPISQINQPTVTSVLDITPIPNTRNIRYVSPDGNNETANDCTDDKNPCKSIRYAIALAEPYDIISVTGIFTERLEITKDLILMGSGAINTIIDGGGEEHTGPLSRNPVITISANITVTIARLTVRNGYSHTAAGIRNFGNLVLEECIVSDNTALDTGGGIDNAASGSISINKCTINNNIVLATDNYGGGIYNSGRIELINSTISGNSAPRGGGITMNHKSTLVAINSTISNNTAHKQVGGISISDDARVILANTIISDNNDLARGWPDCFGVLELQGYNIIGDSTGCSFTTLGDGDIVGVAEIELGLGPLQNNGGSTPTHALLPGSLAIDAGNPSTSSSMPCSNSDQRGEKRPQGKRCDIGAYEFNGN